MTDRAPLEGEVVDAAMPEGQNPSALLAMESAAVDRQIATAKRYPRDTASFLRRAKTHIGEDKDLALACGYETERAGKVLVGPSVRLAEIACAAWGNLRVNVIAGEIGPEDRRLVVFVEVHDLESNVAVRVPRVRSIYGSRGRFTDDMIGVTTQAAVSLAFRDGIFRIVPRNYIRALYEHAMGVAAGDVKDMAFVRKELIDTFAKVGVTKDRLLHALGIEGEEAITLEHVGPLRAIGKRIVLGEVKAETAFPVVDTATAEGAAEALKKGRGKGPAAPKAPAAPAPTTEAPTKPAEQPKQVEQPKPQAPAGGVPDGAV
jgi:hypothetical protein